MSEFFFDKLFSSTLPDYHCVDDGVISCGRLTVFIGANNSGKSRLIRTIFSCHKNSLTISVPIFRAEVKRIFGEIINSFASGHDNTFFDSGDLIKVWSGEPIAYESLVNLVSGISGFLGFCINKNSIGGTRSEVQRSHDHASKINRIHQGSIIDISDDFQEKLASFKRVYIPTLRGMRPFHEESDYNLERTLKDYFSGLNVKREQLVTGFDLYGLLSKFLLGQPYERKIVRNYERLLGEHFFSGQEVTLIPEYGKDTVAVKIGDEEQRPIFELGDGLQQVIIITSSAFLNNDFSLYFIEEPELFLHPGLLKKLMKFLLDETSHQYFCATHSNHILDLSEIRSDVSINKVQKNRNDDGEVVFFIENMIKDRDILERLGVTPSSVFLANSSIWVEGITDRLYLRKYMDKYIKEHSSSFECDLNSYLENFHYMFVEYQGSVLTHWNFSQTESSEAEEDALSAFKLSSEIFVIADGDIAGKKDRANNLMKALGDNVYVLGCKEIENLIPYEVLVETVRRYYEVRRKNKEFVEIDKVDLLSYESYSNSNQGIGRFLDRKCFRSDGPEGGFFSDRSGTIRDKLKFCRIAIEVMDDTEWQLTPPLENLCFRIFSFICDSNK